MIWEMCRPETSRPRWDAMVGGHTFRIEWHDIELPRGLVLRDIPRFVADQRVVSEGEWVDRITSAFAELDEEASDG